MQRRQVSLSILIDSLFQKKWVQKENGSPIEFQVPFFFFFCCSCIGFCVLRGFIFIIIFFTIHSSVLRATPCRWQSTSKSARLSCFSCAFFLYLLKCFTWAVLIWVCMRVCVYVWVCCSRCLGCNCCCCDVCVCYVLWLIPKGNPVKKKTTGRKHKMEVRNFKNEN